MCASVVPAQRSRMNVRAHNTLAIRRRNTQCYTPTKVEKTAIESGRLPLRSRRSVGRVRVYWMRWRAFSAYAPTQLQCIAVNASDASRPEWLARDCCSRTDDAVNVNTQNLFHRKLAIFPIILLLFLSTFDFFAHSIRRSIISGMIKWSASGGALDRSYKYYQYVSWWDGKHKRCCASYTC